MIAQRSLETKMIAEDKTSADEKIDTEVLACNVCRSDRIQKIDSDFNFCRCDSCGYVFDSPRPSFAQIAAFYSQAGKYDTWLNQERARDMLWKRRLRKLLQSGARGRLLDVGTGYGQFLHPAWPFFTEVNGTEVSESAVALAKEKVWPVTPCRPGRGSGPASAILRCHHFVPCFGACARSRQVGERVPCSVESARNINHRRAKRCAGLDFKDQEDRQKTGLRSFQKFSPKLGISRAGTSREIHLSHFTPSVLRRLLENSGLRIIEESLDPYYASTGIRLLLDSACYALHRLLHAALNINHYDTIWMVARKP